MINNMLHLHEAIISKWGTIFTDQNNDPAYTSQKIVLKQHHIIYILTDPYHDVYTSYEMF